MSIIVPSSHTRIGAWVNSKNVGENSTVIVFIFTNYNIVTLLVF